MQADAEAEPAAVPGGLRLDLAQLLADLGGRLAPGEVDVGVLGGDCHGRVRRTAEVDVRDRVGQAGELGAFHLKVLAVAGDRFALPEPGHDVEELAGALVALRLVKEVAVGALLGGLAAGDHVEQQAALRLALEGRGHLGRERGADKARAERDEELQPLGDLGEHRGGEPRVFAPGARRGERAREAQLLGTAGDLAEVLDGRGSDGARRARGDTVAAADDVAAVAVGGQEPVECQ